MSNFKSVPPLPVLPLGGLIVPKFGEIDNWGRPPKLDHSDGEWFCSIDSRVYQKTLFQKKNKYIPPCISLGVSLKELKRIFDNKQWVDGQF